MVTSLFFVVARESDLEEESSWVLFSAVKELSGCQIWWLSGCQIWVLDLTAWGVGRFEGPLFVNFRVGRFDSLGELEEGELEEGEMREGELERGKIT
jgi:hypothetical protein